jgi:hypothetical protein
VRQIVDDLAEPEADHLQRLDASQLLRRLFGEVGG